MIVASLTGNIGCGKSSVMNILKKYEVKTLDSDEIGHKVLELNETKEKLKKEFGEKILTPTEKIDRNELGKIVFDNKEKLRKLNEIVHPLIIKEIYKELNQLLIKEKLVVIEIPLLFETNLQNFFRPIILVYSSKENQIKRIKERNNLKETEIIKRINSQMDIKEKIKKSDYLIENNSTLLDLEKKTIYVLDDIKKNLTKWEKLSRWNELIHLF